MKFRLFRRCRHDHTRCLHGDEVWRYHKVYTFRFWKGDIICRQACVDCRKGLDRTAICTIYPGVHEWNGIWEEAHASE